MKTNEILVTVGLLVGSPLTTAAQLHPSVGPPARYVEGELLVKFAGGPRGAAAEQARNRMHHEVKRIFDFVGWQHVRLPAGLAAAQALSRYRQMGEVLDVQLNHNQPGFASEPPNDPLFSQQYALAKIGATNAWAVSTGSSNVVVAVIDTGINYTHEDLTANMWRNPGEIPGNGLDDDHNGYVDDVVGIDTARHTSDPADQAIVIQGTTFFHGTAHAGIIGATVNNGLGLAGINWSVQTMALKISTMNSIETAAHLEALNYVIMMKQRGINIRCSNHSYILAFEPSIRDAFATMDSLGILSVAAAGNSGANLDLNPGYPAALPINNIVAVASSDRNDIMAGDSSYGPTNVDLAAPGVNITTTGGPGTNAYAASVSGTSFAAPHVTGAAALLFGANPDATAADVKAALLESVDVLPAFTNKMVSNGRLNLGRAVLHPRVTTGPLAFISQPQSRSVVLSNSASFNVSLGGARPVHYQWLFNGVELPGNTNAMLNLDSVAFSQAGGYSVVASNVFGAVTSQVAILTILPLLITSHPTNQNIRLSSNATFQVTVNSPVPAHYQWRFNSTNFVGPDSAMFVLSGVQLSNEGDYSVEVTNAFGSAVSSNAALVVLIDPLITIAPVTQPVVAGGSATFSVAFTGNPMPFGVEWRQGSTTKASNTVWRLQDFFTLTNAQPANAGTWRVIVRNLAKSVVTGENRTFVLTVAADSDGDGLPDPWETAYPAAANPAEDTDHDGLTNLQEYQAGTDPLDSQSYLRIENIAPAGAPNAVSLRFLASPNKTYTVQHRATAEAGEWNRLADVLASPTNRLVEIIDSNGPAADSHRLYRLATPRVP